MLTVLTCVSPRISRFSMGKRCVEEKVYWGSFGKVVVICEENNISLYKFSGNLVSEYILLH